MEISKFATVPPVNIEKLPFSLSKTKIESWLHNLSIEQPYQSCTEVLQILQVLNCKKLSAQKRLMAMETIACYINVFIKPLEKNFIEAGFPLNQEENRYLSVIIWINYELAKGFSLSISETKLSSIDINFGLFYGLNALGNTLLYTSIAYEAPFKGFWQLFYYFYQQARKSNLLEKKISKNSVDLGSIEQHFKQILCFHLCGNNQLQPKEMKHVYHFLSDYAELGLIRSKINKKQSSYYWAFDVSQDYPPAKLLSINGSSAENIYYFSAINVAKAIDHDIQEQPVGTDILHSVKFSLLYKLLKTLSLTQSRKFTRVKEDKPELGIIGFKGSVDYLRNNECVSSPDETVITEYDPRIAGIWTAPNLELLPDGEELVQKMWNTLKTEIKHDKKVNQIFTTRKNLASNDGIWSKKTNSTYQGDTNRLGEFKLRNSSINGYGMVLKNGHQVRTKINELIGFTNNEDERIEIGLIRRIAKSPQGGINFGIELMALEAQALCISKQHKLTEVHWALFLPGIKALNKADSIMFNSNIFAPGDFICLHQGVKKIYCRINKLLHNTDDITHVELYYPATESAIASNSSHR